MSNYPENDYRSYLEHSSRSHKYISRKRGKSGKWIYTYPPVKKDGGESIPLYIKKTPTDSGRVDYEFLGYKRPARNDWIETAKKVMNTSLENGDEKTAKKMRKLMTIFENNAKGNGESSSVGILRYKTRSR